MDQSIIPVLLHTPVRRGCSECDWSWSLQPKNEEVRRSDVGVVVCCLHEKARVHMPDGVYPRLASFVRGDNSLCGGAGKWWTIAKEPVQIETKPQHVPAFYRPKEAASPSRPPRAPYKVK